MLSDDEPLVVQLFNVCQGGADSGIVWNDNFDRVLYILDIHSSMEHLAVHARVIDENVLTMLVSTHDCLIFTKSETARSKVVSHLKHFSSHH